MSISTDRRVPSPTLLVATGAALMALSPTLITLADASAGTVTLVRCALAAVLLLPWVLQECRRAGLPTVRFVVGSVLAGVLLGIDLMLYTESIAAVGGGVASLLLSTQVVAFPLLAWWLDRQPVSSRFVLAAPVLLTGVALTGGIALPDRHVGSAGGLGFTVGAVLGAAAGLAFAGYLYLSRRTSSGERGGGHPLTAVCLASLGAAATAGVLAVPTTGVDLRLPAATWGWLLLLALTGQVLAWTLVNAGAARMAAHRSATVLTLNPVLAVVLGMLLMGERLAWSQVVGAVLVLGAMVLAAGAGWSWRPARRVGGWLHGDHRPELRSGGVVRHLATR